MIISHKYNLVFQPVERTGSQTIETLLKEKDPDCTWLGNFRHEKVTVPDGYQLIISKRNPLERLISWFTKASSVSHMGSPLWTTFEEFLNFMVANQSALFLHDLTASLYAPHQKLIGELLVRFPIPQSYYWENANPTFVIDYANFEANVRNLPFVESSDVVPVVDATDWDLAQIQFEGMEQLAIQYEGVN